MNEKQGTLTTLVWLDLSWDDDYLRWDPEQYDGLSRVELPPRYYCNRIDYNQVNKTYLTAKSGLLTSFCSMTRLDPSLTLWFMMRKVDFRHFRQFRHWR